MGRPGQPNEVAPVFLFLACEDSSYMTGQVLHPNGGDRRQRLSAVGKIHQLLAAHKCEQLRHAARRDH